MSHPAWDMVRAYITRYDGADVADSRIETGLSLPKSPLSVLVLYEIQRRKLSYQRAANLLIRATPTDEAEEPIQAAGLYHIAMTAVYYTASPNALSGLSRGFGWSLDWLRMINGERLTLANDDESLARQLAQDLIASPHLADLLRAARQLTPERILAVIAFAEQLAKLQRGTMLQTTEMSL